MSVHGGHARCVLEGRHVSMTQGTIRLVVNADAFGASESRDLAALLAHRTGIVTSAAILGNAADPASVCAKLRDAPALGTGVLLTLVEGAPVAKAASIPSLLAPDGQLPRRARDVLLNWAKAALKQDEIEQEFEAQVVRWLDAGVRIDHLCTRDNLSALPMVAVAVENVARRHGIANMRTTVEKPTLAWTSDLTRGLQTAALGGMAWWSRRQLGARRHGAQTWGHFESGRLDEIRVLEIIGRLGPGSHELVCQPEAAPASQSVHPGGELWALTSTRVRDAIRRRGIELCRWSDLV
jgi:predicted glycoside hydrolase/deacetylase ChbG (UPF0249 family)